jgi:hypothetical protein
MKTLHFWVEGIADQKLLADLLRVWFDIDFHGNMKPNQTWEGKKESNNFRVFIALLGSVEGIKPKKKKNDFDQNTIQGILNIALLDADDDFQTRKAEIEAYQQEMTFEFFLLPDNQNSGDLETLLEAIINPLNQPIFDCWNGYETCLQTQNNPHSTNGRFTTPARKTKIYAYLEALFGDTKSQKKLIKEANRSYTLTEHWNLDSLALLPLKHFLSAFFNENE